MAVEHPSRDDATSENSTVVGVESLRSTLAAEADLVRVAELFERAGIEFRVLKGLATSHLDHPSPSARPTSDVDVLVRRRDFDRAVAVLLPLVDGAASYPPRRPGWSSRYEKARTLKLRDGSWIDLHQMLVSGWWGLSLDHDVLFERGEAFEVGGVEVIALTPEYRLLHALLHAGYSSHLSEASARDVLVLMGDGPERFGGLRVSGPARGLLAAGALRVATTFPSAGDAWAAWARSVRPSRRERIALSLLPAVRHEWSGLLALPVWEWPRYGWPLAFPSREYLAWWGRTRAGHLGRVTRW